MCGATGVILQLHQILRLPGKMTLMMEAYLKWNVQYNARSNRSHPPTSPDTAPATKNDVDDGALSRMKRRSNRSRPPTSPNIASATKNDSHDWSSSHMKRYLQCAEQHWLPSNITKYCACNEILRSGCQRKILELLPPIQRRFDHGTRRFGDLTHPILEMHSVWKNAIFRSTKFWIQEYSREIPELLPPI